MKNFHIDILLTLSLKMEYFLETDRDNAQIWLDPLKLPKSFHFYQLYQQSQIGMKFKNLLYNKRKHV